MNIFGHHFSPASQNRFRQLIKTEKQKNIHNPLRFHLLLPAKEPVPFWPSTINSIYFYLI